MGTDQAQYYTDMNPGFFMMEWLEKYNKIQANLDFFDAIRPEQEHNNLRMEAQLSLNLSKFKVKDFPKPKSKYHN